MKKIILHKWTHLLILLFVLVSAASFSGSSHEWRMRLQYAVFDTYNQLKPRPATDEIRIVDLDEESLRKLGQWPWPRTVMAQLVDRLKFMGADVVAFDVVFPEPDRTSPHSIAEDLPKNESIAMVREGLRALPDNDTVFAESIKNAGNVVMGFTRASAEQSVRVPHLHSEPLFIVKDRDGFLNHTFSTSGVAENLPDLSRAAAGNGSFMATPDVDGLIRQAALLVRYPPTKAAGRDPKFYPILGLEALRVRTDPNSRLIIRQKADKEKTAISPNYLIKVGAFDIPIEDEAKMWLYYRDIKPDEYISAWKILEPAYEKQLAPRIKDKIIFIGTSAEGLRDIRSTPLDIFIPGVEVHVNLVEQILQQKFLLRPDVVVGLEAIIIFVAGLFIILMAPFLNALLVGVMSISLVGAIFYGSWHAYLTMGLLLDPVYPGGVLFFLFLISSMLTYMRTEYERRQVKQAFGFYISPAFMNELTKNPDKLKLGGEIRDLTVMFTDIRNFTTISEHLTPEELIQLMNDFLTPMSDVVMQNRGTIDKYMGDAMMAFWNAPLDDADHARNACLSALKMQAVLHPVNDMVRARAEERGLTPVLLNAGIGVNTGPCAVGNMGSRQRFAYSALGDAVNLASRLEGQTKAYGVQILVGEETVARAQGLAFVELDLIQVKGKDKPVRIFTLTGDDSVAASDAFSRYMDEHMAFLASYRAMAFVEAAERAGALATSNPFGLEKYYMMMGERIAAHQKTPPPQGWNGVFVAKEK